MSSAFYPQGMNSWNNRSNQGGYKSWKGKGVFSNPVGVTATHIRPLTNNDPGNVFPTGFGLPRPIKHYRKGTVIPVYVPPFTNSDTKLQTAEQLQIDYNVNRAVKSSMGSSLGGGSGGSGLISQMIDGPGQFIVKENEVRPNTDVKDENRIDADCKTCNGVGLVSSWYPINNLSEKPELIVTNPLLCCNQQRKAIQRVLPTSTNVKKNYFQTTDMYLYNRCQTFVQREFNFVSGTVANTGYDPLAKPGSALASTNLYVAQCNPNSTIEIGSQIAVLDALTQALLDRGIITQAELNYYKTLNISSLQQYISQFLDTLPRATRIAAGIALDELSANPYLNALIYAGPTNPRGCKRVYYKPNNPQFAQQGAVSSSTNILKLNVDTITTNAASINRSRLAPNESYEYKLKAPTCQRSTYSGNPFFFQGQPPAKKICTAPNGENDRLFVSVYQHSAGNYTGSTLP
jgi:hypothetical protein